MAKEIVAYNDTAYTGNLNLLDPDVIGVAEYCMKLFLDAPSPHFFSTFYYFWKVNPVQENPVTCSAYGPTLSVHPGQGRLIASVIRNEKTIPALLLSLNQTDQEYRFLSKIAPDIKVYNDAVFVYKNQNHNGISTEHFKEYFYPTDTRLDYEDEKLNLLNQDLDKYYPIAFLFDDREPILLGKQENNHAIATRVMCHNARGLYEAVAHLGSGVFNESENFKIQ